MSFETKTLPVLHDVVAPDGSDVRILLGLEGGTMAHFELRPGATSVAIRHRTVDEIWFVVSGRGRIWRRDGGGAIEVVLTPRTCLTIPVGTEFQFRCEGDEALQILGVTMPPWPGAGEAIRCRGPWTETTEPGPGLVDD
jgi:mannose-6-phosphate isomerase-like protein (cupin superfamily)